jgi:phosphoribosylanthranilate isomerase
MTWVKICGITNLEDALTAVNAGADAVGFVFYEKSPRNVSPETVREIIRQLPAHIEKIGVFVGNNPKNLPEFVDGLGLTGSQLHFRPGFGPADETKAYGLGCFSRGFKSYVSWPADWFTESEDSATHFIDSARKAAEMMRYDPGGEQLLDCFQTIFLDSGNFQQPGGTGTVFDWEKAAPVVDRLKQAVRVVVAGGLNPVNVSDAIHILKPWGVDVSSGVEAKPGKKDPQKVRAFMEAVRQTEKVV